jgi:hypothetical protein
MSITTANTQRLNIDVLIFASLRYVVEEDILGHLLPMFKYFVFLSYRDQAKRVLGLLPALRKILLTNPRQQFSKKPSLRQFCRKDSMDTQKLLDGSPVSPVVYWAIAVPAGQGHESRRPMVIPKLPRLGYWNQLVLGSVEQQQGAFVPLYASQVVKWLRHHPSRYPELIGHFGDAGKSGFEDERGWLEVARHRADHSPAERTTVKYNAFKIDIRAAL